MTENIREDIWVAWLDAQMNVLYFQALRQRYQRREQALKIIIAISSSASVASWAVWQDLKTLWQVLSSATSVIAIAHPILNYSELIGSFSDLHGMWIRAESQWHHLWLKVNDGKEVTIDECAKVREYEVSVGEKESKAPRDDKLLKRCQGAVRNSLGL